NGDTSSNITQKYAYSQPGVYPIKLTIRSATGCEVITEGEVRVDSFAIARFEINNDTQCLRNNSFRFDNYSLGANKYLWEIGEGPVAVTTNVSHTYANPGTYNVRLSASNDAGCGSSITKKIYVAPSPTNKTIIGKNATDTKLTDSFYVSNTAGSSYVWTITNGTITSGQGTHKIHVTWTK